MRSLLVALAFLTVLPIRFRTLPAAETVGRSRWWYPVVGLALGAVLGAWTAALSAALRSSTLGAFLVLLAWVTLTGALHLDGFCDLCDGLFGGHTADDRLHIMKDPHLGTFGLAGGLLLLLGKFVALEAILERDHAPWVVGAAVVAARCLVLVMAAGSRYPRAEGTGRVIVEAVRAWEAWLFAVVAGAAIAVAFSWNDLAGVAAFAAAVAAVLVLKWLCRRRLGGITGDCLGAAVEMVEAVVLWAAAIAGQRP